MAVKHRFVSPKADDPDTTLVRPSNWNDTHEIEAGTIDTAELADGSVTAVKLDPGLSIPDDTMRTVYGLNALFRVALTDNYVEYTYTGSRLTGVDVWETSGKTTKLFTRTITYTGSQITSVVTVDNVGGSTLTRTNTWSGSRLSTSTDAIT